MRINTQTKTIHYVNHSDLDEAVDAFLKKKGIKLKEDYESVEYQNWQNDSHYKFRVGPCLPSQSNLREMTEPYNILYAILDWMCEDNEIPAGEYDVHVSW